MSAATDCQVRAYDHQYIDGAWVRLKGAETVEVTEAATGTVIATVALGGVEEVDRAAQAAARAFADWAATPREERSAWLARIAAALEVRADEIATAISREVGMPLALSKRVQAGLAVRDFANMPLAMTETVWEETIGTSIVVREPIGVVGAITPWNYPLHQICAKAAAALAAGCTIVVKPSEVAPAGAYALAEIIDSLGLPAGVFNLVSGTGPVAGEALARHPLVDMVSFTGSTVAGRRVSEVASQSVKRVALELGGKSPAVILDDADLHEAIAGSVTRGFQNSGQTCTALTRLLVPRSRLADAEAAAAEVATTYVMGNPLDDSTTLGPLVSAAQRDRVLAYIRTGLREGAKLVCGGDARPEGLGQGYFVAPTVLSEVTADMVVAREEIFGPVLVILSYEDDDDAVRIANDTDYGLSGAVWSADQERAKAVGRRLRTGQVYINGGAFNSQAPFGGYKQSGYGRELGRYGLEEFLSTKSFNL